MSTAKNYFQGLNSIRAIAALVVLIGHVELIKSEYKLPNLLHLDYFKYTSGQTGVVLFFVLSGFLITYILLQEQKQKNAISLRAFYAKRILRVWPLYFVILILSLIIFQYHPSATALLLCLLIFPNISHALGLSWEVSPQLWSIGVEEQFYLVHPLLVGVLKKYLLWFLILFFGAWTLTPQFIICTFEPSAEVENFIRNFAYGSKYNCMALGGICAILQMKYAGFFVRIFRNNLVALILVLIPFTFWFIAYPVYLNDLAQICYTKIEVTQEIFAILFGILILVIANNDFIARLFSFRWMDYLGKISYGIYMYHWIVILLVLKFIFPIFESSYAWANTILYGLSIAFTILISALSFHYFESIFMRIRDKLVAKKNK